MQGILPRCQASRPDCLGRLRSSPGRGGSSVRSMMGVLASIFLDFNLPNAATWFYFSLLLGIALFFKFSRLLSVRNVDVLTLFLLVPGLLLLQEGRQATFGAQPPTAVKAAQFVLAAGESVAAPAEGISGVAPLAGAAAPTWVPASRLVWFG